MKKIIPFLVFTIVTLCLAYRADAAQALEQIKQDAIDKAHCFLNKTSEYDDGVSDPITIARAVMSACKKEITKNNTFIISSAYLDNNEKEKLIARQREEDLDDAIRCVFIKRKQKKSGVPDIKTDAP